MMDVNDFMRRLGIQGQDSAALSRLSDLMRTPQGQQMAQHIDSNIASRIEQAARAAQAGNQQAAQAALREILSTPEGASLAASLRSILGK